MPVGQMSVGGTTDSGPKHQTDTQGRVSLYVWSEQCQSHRQRQHTTNHGHALSSRIKIKILDPAGNRAQDARLEGRTLPITPRKQTS